MDNMHSKINKFDSGWSGITFSLKREEIDLMLTRLRELNEGKISHFHFRCDDFEQSTPNIADVEFSINTACKADDLSIE